MEPLSGASSIPSMPDSAPASAPADADSGADDASAASSSVGSSGSSGAAPDDDGAQVGGVQLGPAAPPKNDRDQSRFDDGTRQVTGANTRIGPTGNAQPDAPTAPTAQSRYNDYFSGVQTGSSRSTDTDRTAYSGRGATVKTETSNNNGQVTTATQNSHISKAGNDVQQAKRTGPTEAAKGDSKLKVSNNSRFQLLDPNVAKTTVLGSEAVQGKPKAGPLGSTVEGHYQGPSVNITGNAYGVTTGSGLQRGLTVHVDAKLDANAISGGASATRDFNFHSGDHDYTVRLKLGADGNVGINGTVKLDIHAGLDGAPRFTVGAEGFAGAQGKLSGDVRVLMDGDEKRPLLQGELSVTAGAGAGAAYELSGGIDHFHARAMAYAGVGVGAELTGHVNWTQLENAMLPKGTVMPWDARAQWWGPLNHLQFWQGSAR